MTYLKSLWVKVVGELVCIVNGQLWVVKLGSIFLGRNIIWCKGPKVLPNKVKVGQLT